MDFMSNFLFYVSQTYEGYKKKVLDESLKIRNFQFRLIDLEFVLNDFQNYTSYAFNPIKFECFISRENLALAFIGFDVEVLVSWECKGILQLENNQTVEILGNFHYI